MSVYYFIRLLRKAKKSFLALFFICSLITFMVMISWEYNFIVNIFSFSWLMWLYRIFVRFKSYLLIWCTWVRKQLASSFTMISVGPCALDYSKTRTPDQYWNDPPADELVQRHRISSGHTTPPSCRKTPINVSVGLVSPGLTHIHTCTYMSFIFTHIYLHVISLSQNMKMMLWHSICRMVTTIQKEIGVLTTIPGFLPTNSNIPSSPTTEHNL